MRWTQKQNLTLDSVRFLPVTAAPAAPEIKFPEFFDSLLLFTAHSGPLLCDAHHDYGCGLPLPHLWVWAHALRGQNFPSLREWELLCFTGSLVPYGAHYGHDHAACHPYVSPRMAWANSGTWFPGTLVGPRLPTHDVSPLFPGRVPMTLAHRGMHALPFAWPFSASPWFWFPPTCPKRNRTAPPPPVPRIETFNCCCVVSPLPCPMFNVSSTAGPWVSLLPTIGRFTMPMSQMILRLLRLHFGQVKSH